ncbi:MAG: C10 family peptidase, partial [Candidatus Eisenbacteria bacterium]|nr:C10 family peptidase [Candidatus Eisenbacteria bacterium]
ATAASQIMTHWCWPPYGVGSPYGDLYDWPNMYNGCFYEYYAGCFLDRDSDPHVCLTQAQIDAVAELCAEAGQAMLMDYGCDASSAFMDDVESAFENNFRYSSNANVVYRRDYTGAEWFDMIKAQLNLNRPMEYAVLGHAIVCDGWQEPGGIREYHMNYGWDDYYNAWYTLDALHYPSGGELDDERMLRTIHPNVGIGATFSGTYNPGSMPYLYFMVSSEGVSATFNSGQYIQFLPGITVGCFGDHVTFHGGSPQTTLLFTRGDRTQGARLFGGALKIHPGGEVRLP